MNLLTILIPTFNRPSFLQFHLEYHKNFKSRYQLIIADGSIDKEILIKNYDIINNYKKYLNIHYFADKCYYYERVNKALKFVRTKYCILHADDDLYSFDFLKEGLDILEKNKKITSVFGLTSSVYLNELNSKFYYDNNFYHNYKLSNLFLNSRDLEKRVLEISKFNLSSAFFLQKTVDLIKKIEAIELIRKENFGKQTLDIFKEFRLGFLYEMICIIYTSCLGRSFFIKKNMICRLYHKKNAGNRSRLINLTNIFFNNKLYSNCSLIYNHLHKCTKIPLEKSRQITTYFFFNLFNIRFFEVKKETINKKFLPNIFRKILNLKLEHFFEKFYFNKLFNFIRNILYLYNKDRIYLNKFIINNMKLLKK